ncbi:hypothetical protein MBAV_001361, partial [Candidatus Magnetobacterium bavaricum]
PIFIKVIRPQDMPMHVAANGFDLAITGTDWLFEHEMLFPNTPVRKLLSSYSDLTVLIVL